MSASALVLLWVGVLLLGSALIVSLLVGRVLAARREREAHPPLPDAGSLQDGGDPRGERGERLRNLLLSRMSHDLRSPLNSVVTLSQLLWEGNAGALSIEQRRYVEVIRHSGQTLLALINDILDLAAVESGRVEIELGYVDLSALIQTVADGIAAQAAEKRIPIEVRRPIEPLVAKADGEHLRQILQRLAEHAVAETRNGYVELAAEPRRDRRQAVLRIREAAETLNEPTRRALAADREDFEDYVAGETAFGERSPAPLPLVVAARLARAMGLHVGVGTGAADGVSFELEVPLDRELGDVHEMGGAAAPAAAPSPPALDGEDALAPGLASGQVLLIEDDLIERQRVRELLESRGYDITLAGSGEEGLALLRAGHFDAVVLDLVMPGMSGLDVLRVARTDERLAEIPFVVLSALYMTKGERAVLGPRVTSVVRKGDATADELALSLRRAIKGPHGEARPQSGHGGPHA